MEAGDCGPDKTGCKFLLDNHSPGTCHKLRSQKCRVVYSTCRPFKRSFKLNWQCLSVVNSPIQPRPNSNATLWPEVNKWLGFCCFTYISSTWLLMAAFLCDTRGLIYLNQVRSAALFLHQLRWYIIILTVNEYSHKHNCSCFKVSFQPLTLTSTRGVLVDRWDASNDRNAQILAWLRTGPQNWSCCFCSR